MSDLNFLINPTNILDARFERDSIIEQINSLKNLESCENIGTEFSKIFDDAIKNCLEIKEFLEGLDKFYIKNYGISIGIKFTQFLCKVNDLYALFKYAKDLFVLLDDLCLNNKKLGCELHENLFVLTETPLVRLQLENPFLVVWPDLLSSILNHLESIKKEFPTFLFISDSIIDYADNFLKNDNERLIYMKWILSEYPDTIKDYSKLVDLFFLRLNKNQNYNQLLYDLYIKFYSWNYIEHDLLNYWSLKKDKQIVNRFETIIQRKIDFYKNRIKENEVPDETQKKDYSFKNNMKFNENISYEYFVLNHDNKYELKGIHKNQFIKVLHEIKNSDSDTIITDLKQSKIFDFNDKDYNTFYKYIQDIRNDNCKAVINDIMKKELISILSI